MDCLEIEIVKNYETWKSHAIGLTRSKVEGEELLHKVLESVMTSGNARIIACEHERKGTLKYYVDRAIWLTFQTQRVRKKQHINIDEVREIRDDGINFDLAGEHFDVLINWLSEYERELLKMYITEGFQMKSAAQEMGICRKRLSNEIKKAAKKLFKYAKDSETYQAR